MDSPAVADVPALFRAGLAVAGQPLLTYHDDATGERTELSAAALGGWAARTAGLLREGCGLAPGSRARHPHSLTPRALGVPTPQEE